MQFQWAAVQAPPEHTLGGGGGVFPKRLVRAALSADAAVATYACDEHGTVVPFQGQIAALRDCRFEIITVQ